MIELGLKVTLAYLLGSVLGSLLVGWLLRRRRHPQARQRQRGRHERAAHARQVCSRSGSWSSTSARGSSRPSVIPPLAIPGVGFDPRVDRSLVLYAVAFAAIAGHVFPVWFGFRGGKGGATAAGLLCLSRADARAADASARGCSIVFSTGFVGLATISASLVAVVLLGFTALARAERPVRVRVRYRGAARSTRTAATSAACWTARSRGSRARRARWLRRGQ